MACFRCQVNPPQSRLISLEKLPTEFGTLELDCLVELLCPSCLRLAIDDFCEGFAQSSIPVGANETPDFHTRRQIGCAVVPITLSERESGLLIDELRTNGFETVAN
jgi:hypothetical protein